MGAIEFRGPRANAPAPALRFDMNNPAESAALDVGSLFDESAVSYRIAEFPASDLVSATLDPTTGLLGLDFASDRYGLVFINVEATDAGGDASLLRVPIHVFPAP